MFPGLSFCSVNHNFVIETSFKFFVCIVMIKSHTKETALFKKSTITDPKETALRNQP